jgi:hypothetical protein
MLRSPVPALLLTTAALMAADPSADRAGQIPVIDGKLDEAAWTTATWRSDFGPIVGWDDRKLTVGTKFACVVDDQAVYVAVDCAEEGAPKVPAPAGRDAAGVFARDVVEIFCDPTGTGTSFYQFAVAISGDQFDIYRIEGGRTVVTYSAQWDSAVQVGGAGWSAEIRIPLAAFTNTPADAFRPTWKFNVGREHPGRNQYASWSPVIGGFQDSDHFRFLAGMPVRSGALDQRIAGITAGSFAADGAGEVGVTLSGGDQVTGKGRVAVTVGSATAAAPVTFKSGMQHVVVPGISLPTEGKADIQVVIEADDGRVVSSRRVVINPERERLAVQMTSPVYAGTIFPDAPVTDFTADLTIKGALPAGAKLAATLIGPEAAVIASAEVAAAQNVTVGFPIAELPVGSYAVRFQLRAGDGSVIAVAERPLRKLGNAPEGVASLRINADRQLVINGKPRIFLGWYGGPVWGMSQKLQQQYPRLDSFFPMLTGDNLVNAMPERLAPICVENGELNRDQKPSEAVLEIYRKHILAHRDKPDTWMYYLADEPDYRGVSSVYMKHLYDLIKELDPWHPVFIISTAPWQWTDCADILAPHNYIAPSVDATNTRRSFGLHPVRDVIVQSVATTGRDALWATPQAFSYAFENLLADYPTWDEYRASLWLSIASGATGLYPFIYCGAFDRPALRLGSRHIYESLFALEPLLLRPDEPFTVATTGNVQTLIKRSGDQVLMIAVNLDEKPVQAAITAPALGDGPLTVFRDSATVQSTAGTVSVSLPAMGVLVVGRNLEHLEQGLSTESDFVKELAAAEADRRPAGSLLFMKGREIEIDAAAPDALSFNSKAMRATLFDGVRDALSWRGNKSDTTRVTLLFPENPLSAGRFVISGWKLAGARLETFARGTWTVQATATAADEQRWSVVLPEAVETPKMRLSFPGQGEVELYDVEAFAK